MKKTQKPAGQSAAFVSLGCFKNTVDSEVLAGMLQERGNGDRLRIRKSRLAGHQHLRLHPRRQGRKHRGDPGRPGKKGKGRNEKTGRFRLPDPALLPGTESHVPAAPTSSGASTTSRNWPTPSPPTGPADYPDKKLFLYDDRHRRQPFTTANSSFIKISEGCNMTCSFCAIPQIRGAVPLADDPFHPEGSRDLERKRRRRIEPDLPELDLFRQGQGKRIPAAGPAEGNIRIGLPLAARPVPDARRGDPGDPGRLCPAHGPAVFRPSLPARFRPHTEKNEPRRRL